MPSPGRVRSRNDMATADIEPATGDAKGYPKTKEPGLEVCRGGGLMWSRMVDIGAHQACCPLLQALFMTAKAPTMSTVMVRIINMEVFICDLATAGPKAYRPRFSAVRNEPTLNTRVGGQASNRGADCLRVLNRKWRSISIWQQIQR